MSYFIVIVVNSFNNLLGSFKIFINIIQLPFFIIDPKEILLLLLIKKNKEKYKIL
jgi:hypothetical protein